MTRYIVGALAALLLVAGGVVLWREEGRAQDPIPPVPAAAAEQAGVADAGEAPPQASARTREEKRFGRYDKDKDGAVAREEYLAARRKAYAKLDTDGDGRLSFEEYAVKTTAKFASADADRSGRLTPAEFATTRVVRKTPARCACPPTGTADEE